MLGSMENCKKRKLVQKIDNKYNFSFAWFDEEKGKEKKTSRKVIGNDMPKFSH